MKLPIKLDATSNGEYAPTPLPPELAWARTVAGERIVANSRKLNIDRRSFIGSTCAAASVLLAFNSAHASMKRRGGWFNIDPAAEFELAAAEQALAGDEFIFDVHTHMVNPAGSWRTNRGAYWEEMLANFPQAKCGESDPVDCFSADYYIREIFENSDTDLALLSFVPEVPGANPLDPKEARRAKTLADRLGDARERLLLHGMVVPNLKPYGAQLAAMERAATEWPIAGWKVYTQWGPDGVGWALDDPDIGIPFIEKARSLGIRNICVHKGLPFPSMPLEFAGCADIGRVAKLYPDMNFLVYHSGFVPGVTEGPYSGDGAELGVDSLVRSLLENGVSPNSNVYADLGATWWIIMRYPDAAAHVLGKLIKHVGENRVLWGTDCIWFGSPQDQIQMMRSFEITDEYIEKYDYSPLTKELKRKIFGLNAAEVYNIDAGSFLKHASGDWISRKLASGNRQSPQFATYGPKSFDEYSRLKETDTHWPF